MTDAADDTMPPFPHDLASVMRLGRAFGLQVRFELSPPTPQAPRTGWIGRVGALDPVYAPSLMGAVSGAAVQLQRLADTKRVQAEAELRAIGEIVATEQAAYAAYIAGRREQAHAGLKAMAEADGTGPKA